MEEKYIIETALLKLTELDLLIRILIATGIGFVLGMEREFSKLDEKVNQIAGIRTFSIVSIFGLSTALLGVVFQPWIFIIGLVGVIVLVGISYRINASKGDMGGTTEFALFLAFVLGGAVLLGFIKSSLAVTVILLVILSSKLKLHTMVGQLTQKEIFAFVQFVVLAVLILPFLPDVNMGPFDVVNPREMGWVIVLTSGIGFVGYMLTKFVGANKGILITGILGGMVSSTVVTWTFSKKSKVSPQLSDTYAVGIFAAACVMICRVFVLVYIFNSDLLPGLLVPLLVILGVAIAVTWFFNRKQKNNGRVIENIPLGEPLNIKEAITFGFLYTAILILVSYASNTYGDSGIYISSAISALTDIDAITISVSKLAGKSISVLTAQNAILIATLSNTVVKIGISLYSGSKQLKKDVLLGYGAVFIAGVIGFVILN